MGSNPYRGRHDVVFDADGDTIGFWCTLSVGAADVMLIMIPFAVDDVIAMGQLMAEQVRASRSDARSG